MTEKEAKKLETKCSWSKTLKRWLCNNCGQPPKTHYVATGHDHIDYSIWWCECRKENVK